MTDIAEGLRAMAEGFEEEGHELLASTSAKGADEIERLRRALWRIIYEGGDGLVSEAIARAALSETTLTQKPRHS